MVSRPQQAGMAYLITLLMVAFIGGASAVLLERAETQRVRQAETELLAIGREFRAALKSYAEATPIGFPTAPERLEELLRDPRQAGIRRHWRRIYADPLTGKADWQILRTPEGRIAAIASRSHTPVFRQENLPRELADLAGRAFHDEWVFGDPPPALPAPCPGIFCNPGSLGRLADSVGR